MFGPHTRDPTRGWGGGENQMSKVVRFRIRERGIWHAEKVEEIRAQALWEEKVGLKCGRASRRDDHA